MLFRVVVLSYDFDLVDLQELLKRMNDFDRKADSKQSKAELDESTTLRYRYVDALIAGACRKASNLDATYHDNDGNIVDGGKVKDMPEGKRHIIFYTQLVKLTLEIVDGYDRKQSDYENVVEKHKEIVAKLRKVREVGQLGKHTFAGWKELGKDDGKENEDEYHTLGDLTAKKLVITDITGYESEQIIITSPYDRTPIKREK